VVYSQAFWESVAEMTISTDGILYSVSTMPSLPAGHLRGTPMYKVVRASRLYEQIVQQIEGSIREGRLKPGDQLPAERELALEFGVSRTAVREAVKTLSEKGLVEAYSGRGTFVTTGKSQSIRHSLDSFLKSGDLQDSNYVAEMREILEPEFTALAATRIEEQHMVMMREAVAIMDRSMQNPDAYIEADLDFHLALAEAAGNPLILSLLDSLVGVLREQRIGIFAVTGGPERGQFHHKLILEAIEQRSASRARKAMRAHLQQIRQDSTASAILSSKSRKGNPS
jgi:GntR family transcriptional regulator, transcriptional repressor for pyruvate dehydrogenase complex